MPQFVVLEHHYQGVHWDFMIEAEDALRTWRLADPPAFDQLILATPLPDHRRIYLDYEGPISGERGFVTRWDEGEFQWLSDESDAAVLEMHGQRVIGRVYLCKRPSGDWSFQLTSSTPRPSDSTTC